MMRRFGLAVLICALSVPAHAGFNEVRGALDERLGRRVWIPLLGLVRTVVRVGHPRGVHDLQLAVFEGAGSLDGQELDRMMRRYAGRDYRPMVRVRSRDESSIIYARPVNGKVDLLMLMNEDEDTVLVRVVIDPAVLGQYLDDDPRRVATIARR